MKVVVFANTFQIISGGEVIAVEVAKQWLRLGHRVTFITTQKGKAFCRRRGLKQNHVQAWIPSWIDRFGIYFSSAVETIISLFRGLFFNPKPYDTVFSASIFWPDIFPAAFAKIRQPKIKLIVGAYLIFPNPFTQKYNGSFLKSLVLFLSQMLSLWFISLFADLVLTASELDRQNYFNQRQLNPNSVIAIRGGIDTREIKQAKSPRHRKKYDAVYLGRFHSQKGLLDLLTIWKKVLKVLPRRRLLLIGAGPEEKILKTKVAQTGLQNNIDFCPPVDGLTKYELLKSAKVFISSSQFDTGNIALDEAMACGIPGIVYDLPHFNYQAGVILVAKGKQNKMANEVIKILSNHQKRLSLGEKAKKFIKQFDWHNRAKLISASLNFGQYAQLQGWFTIRGMYPSISVVIPTKNSAWILPVCLSGLKKQHYPKNKIEIIIADNDSTDSTVLLAKKANAKLVNQKGRPPLVCQQRNLGAKKAKHQWLLFLDHDMELGSTVLADFARQLSKHPDTFAWFIPEKIITGSKLLSKIRNFERQFYNQTPIDAVRIIKKSVFFKTANQYDSALSAGPADWDLDIQLKQLGCRFGSLTRPLYHHEERLNLFSYVFKKGTWLGGLEIYKSKWQKKYKGKYQYIINQQFGLKYRIITVFFEKKKWKKVVKHIDLYLATLGIKLAMLCLSLYKRLTKHG